MKEIAGLENKKEIFTKRSYLHYWVNLFNHVKNKPVDTWDASWQYSLLKNNGYSITPTNNLITNIGFGSNATHTKTKEGLSLPTNPIPLPINHPPEVLIDTKADNNLMVKLTRKNFRQKLTHLFKIFFKR